MKKSYTQGWVCPLCGRVFSPHIHMCPYCGPKSGDTEQPYIEPNMTPVGGQKKPQIICS